ncbi:MAG: hypothetical protein R3C03_00655 [Pirellulaceae bacterium]
MKTAIDQAADVGFEAIILSFGSGFDMENQDRVYFNLKGVADYAESKGIEIGAYSLFSSRNVGAANMIVSRREQLQHRAVPCCDFGMGANLAADCKTAFFRKPVLINLKTMDLTQGIST